MHQPNSRDALLEQIRREFDVVVDSVSFGDMNLEIVRVADPDSLLDDRTLLDDHQHLAWHPYWAEAWAASYGVAEALATRDLADQTVLDLGCGLGITGAVAAARGASVVLGDHAPPSLPFARWNTWPWRSRVRVQLLDWRKDALPERFDWIVGSEILYDRNELRYLDAFWKQHLKARGKVLLGDAQRAISGEMLERLQALGWQIETTLHDAAAQGRPLRMVELWRQ